MCAGGISGGGIMHCLKFTKQSWPTPHWEHTADVVNNIMLTVKHTLYAACTTWGCAPGYLLNTSLIDSSLRSHDDGFIDLLSQQLTLFLLTHL